MQHTCACIHFYCSRCVKVPDAKQLNLPSSVMEKIVTEDIQSRQALITADFTRSIYSESCRFQDEIDIYPIDDYVKGTKLLFNSALSHVDLIGPVTTISDDRFVLFHTFIHIYIYRSFFTLTEPDP